VNDFPELDGVRLLWHADYWDGPLAGLARHNGQDYWFEVEVFDWDDPPAERRYLLYSLTEEELAEERGSGIIAFRSTSAPTPTTTSEGTAITRRLTLA
jgi:hypothetical protein